MGASLYRRYLASPVLWAFRLPNESCPDFMGDTLSDLPGHTSGWIGGESKVLLKVGLQPKGAPDPDNGILIEPADLSNVSDTPVGTVLGAHLQPPGDHVLNLLVVDLARST